MNIAGEQQIPKDKNNEQDDFDDMNEEEFEFTNSGGENKADDEFDQVVGALQEIVLDPEFEQHQRDFLGKYCMAFDKEEENKLEYMTIFKDYQDKIEKYIEQKLKETLPNSNMKDFLSQLQSRIEEIDPQLLEMLETFTDFQLFKEHMLAHKDTQPAMDKFEESKGEETKNVELTVAGHAIELEDPEKMVEEFEFTNSGGENKADDEFDQVVGALQEIVLEPEFEQQQNDFLGKHCMTFDNEEENKLEYTSIFKEYQDKIENYIEQKLKETMPNSNMKDFLSQLQSRIDEIDPQLLDMLETFTDFQLFKEHMLAHKKLQMSLEKKSKKFEQYTQETGGMAGIEQDLGGLTVAGHAKAIHSGNEQNLKEVQGTKDVLGAKENVTKPQEANMEKKPKVEDAGQPPKKVGKANADYVPQQKENIFS